MMSDEGLNAYGALTWGQFFIYQGFNERAGWMHTSSGVDNIDEYLETVVKKGDGVFYRYGTEERADDDAARSSCRTRRRPAWRSRSSRSTARITGPIVREADGKWVARAADAGAGEGADAVVLAHQGARTYAEFREMMELHTNSSNNTIFADADGNIAYFHSNFIPKRDPQFDWTQAGRRQRSRRPSGRACTRSTRRPNVVNPPSGWVYNTNNWPWSAAGPEQPEAGATFRAYVDTRRREPARHPRDPRAARTRRTSRSTR